jgi:predicted permease
MRLLYIVALRLRSLLRRNRVEQDLADELQFHIDERTRELVERGMDAGEARHAALRAFGGVEQRKEECRDARGVGYIEDAAQDIRYALRGMWRQPLFAAVAIASLAIGIGANTAIFSAVDALLLKPLPVRNPEELRIVGRAAKARAKILKTTTMVPVVWLDPLRQQTDIFSELAAFEDRPDVAIRRDRFEHAGRVVRVSGNYFSMLGVGAHLGSVLGAHDNDAAVLGYHFWRAQLNSDTGVIGQTIVIDNRPFTVIGVAARDFFGLALGRDADAYVALDERGREVPVVAVGRLRPGVNDLAASDRLTTLSKGWGAMGPNPPPYAVELQPPDTGLSDLRARFMQPLAILMVMVAGLLLVGCANVATLLLSRASARRTEIVIRSAMGAGQGRLLRQLATESALLVAIAAVIGIAASSWATTILITLMQSIDSELAVDLSVDRRTLLFTATVSAIAALVAGLSPARHAANVSAAMVLKERREAAASATHGRFGQPFVVVQVALSLTLVVAAGLLVRTLHGLATVDAGFDIDRVVLATVHPGDAGYKGTAPQTYFRELQRRLRTAPGVEAVSLAQFSVLSDARTTGTFRIPGFTPPTDEEEYVQVYQVGPGFFSTMGMTIVEGRDFSDEDMETRTPQATALNESAAQRYFGGRSPVGQVIGTMRIIAVVGDARFNTLREQTGAVIFYPYAFANRNRMTYAVRVSSEAAGARTVAGIVRELDASVPMQMTTLETVAYRNIAQERLLAVIAAFFAGTALLLLSLGLYGVMAFWVTERTSEIGVRVALGAGRAQVVWSVLRGPLAFVLLGTICGVVVSLAGGRLIAGFLFGLAPQDPVTIVGASLILICVAMCAGLLPARRAASVDPIVALRCE